MWSSKVGVTNILQLSCSRTKHFQFARICSSFPTGQWHFQMSWTTGFESQTLNLTFTHNKLSPKTFYPRWNPELVPISTACTCRSCKCKLYALTSIAAWSPLSHVQPQTGYRISLVKSLFLYPLAALPLGFGLLLAYWFPHAWLRLISRTTPLSQATYVIVKVWVLSLANSLL